MRTYLSKILIFLFLVTALFSACSSKTYTPVLPSEFNLNAVYQTGDFSYTCKIIRTAGALSVTPTSSYAKGMTIKFDGKTVTYLKDDMEKNFDREIIDSTNPAILLYEVFYSLENTENLQAELKDGEFEYKGKTSLGDFVLLQSRSNALKSISVPDAKIMIEFED